MMSKKSVVFMVAILMTGSLFVALSTISQFSRDAYYPSRILPAPLTQTIGSGQKALDLEYLAKGNQNETDILGKMGYGEWKETVKDNVTIPRGNVTIGEEEGTSLLSMIFTGCSICCGIPLVLLLILVLIGLIARIGRRRKRFRTV